jgi:sugar phosphate isomerase/epimerase
MGYNRRLFLKNSGLFASGIAVAGLGIGCVSPTDKQNGDNSTDTGSVSNKSSSSQMAEQALAEFGLQLYTLRDDLPKDVKGILKQVASFGYKQVEGFEGKLGIWWGMSHKDFKKYLDEVGLTMISSHCNTKENFEKKAAEAKEVGLKYLIEPWLGPQKKLDDYKKAADRFNKLGEICKKNDLRFAYHNHGYSFTAVDGQYPQDIMMQNTDPNLVDFEMDMYWVVVPGEDPIKWLQKYPKRFKLCHIKDREKTAPKGEPDASTDLGTGSIDFKKLLRVAKENGVEYYIVEQEKYANTTPIKAAEVDAQYLKNLRF